MKLWKLLLLQNITFSVYLFYAYATLGQEEDMAKFIILEITCTLLFIVILLTNMLFIMLSPS